MVALTGTVSQVLAHSLPAMLMTGQAEEVVAWVSLPQVPRWEGVQCSSQVGGQWDPHSWTEKGGSLPGTRSERRLWG